MHFFYFFYFLMHFFYAHCTYNKWLHQMYIQGTFYVQYKCMYNVHLCHINCASDALALVHFMEHFLPFLTHFVHDNVLNTMYM